MHENEVELGKRKRKKKKRERHIQYLEARNWLQMPLWLLDLPSLKLAHCYVHRLKDADT